ncbi:MAG: hypothetical protein WBD42_07270 [Methylovirgula sp.]
MALLWNFRYYPLDDAGTGVRNVYENASTAVRGKFLSKLVILAQLDISQWREPLFKMLTNQGGLSEIRFKADGVQQRPLGFRSGEHEYTLLLWATEKGGRFVPRSAPETAASIMIEVLNGRELTDALWLALE